MPNRFPVAVLLSGGIDSAVLAGKLAEEGCVQPLFVRGGLRWEHCEEAAARRFLAALHADNVLPLVTFDQPAQELYADHWSLTGDNVPDATTPDDAVYLPGRNALLLLKPLLWCQMRGIRRIALGSLAGNPFADATPKFFTALSDTLALAAEPRVAIETPFGRLHKREVLALGRHLPLSATFSCIDPVAGVHCGRCNKCHERRAGFAATGIQDKTEYAADDPAAC